MPDSPEADMEKITAVATTEVEKFGGRVERSATEPVAFGLNALLLTVSVDEDKGDLEPLETAIGQMENVNSVIVSSISRSLG